MRSTPLPTVGPAKNRRGEFEKAEQLIAHAHKAIVSERRASYQRNLDDKFIELGLQIATSATSACKALAELDAFWCCVCARPYLEFSLRFLWASREQSGIARMYSYYAKLHRAWMEKLAKNNPEYQALLAEMDSAAPLTKLPEPKMPEMRALIKQIGAKDKSESVPTLYADASDYDETVGFLHNFSHANPLLLGNGPDEYLPHAAHAIVIATNALLRAVGYRMNWDQASVIRATIGISSLESLSVEEREEFRRCLE